MSKFSSTYNLDFQTGTAPPVPLHVLLDFLLPARRLPFLNALDEDSYFLDKLKKHLAAEEKEEENSDRSLSPWSQLNEFI